MAVYPSSRSMLVHRASLLTECPQTVKSECHCGTRTWAWVWGGWRPAGAARSRWERGCARGPRTGGKGGAQAVLLWSSEQSAEIRAQRPRPRYRSSLFILQVAGGLVVNVEFESWKPRFLVTPLIPWTCTCECVCLCMCVCACASLFPVLKQYSSLPLTSVFSGLLQFP